jgi:hypothetical protein
VRTCRPTHGRDARATGLRAGPEVGAPIPRFMVRMSPTYGVRAYQKLLRIHSRPAQQIRQRSSDARAQAAFHRLPPSHPFAPHENRNGHHPHESPSRQCRSQHQSNHGQQGQRQPIQPLMMRSCAGTCVPSAVSSPGNPTIVVKHPILCGCRNVNIRNFSNHRSFTSKKFQPPRPRVLSVLSPSLTNFAIMELGHRRTCIYQAEVVSKKSSSIFNLSSV